MKKFFVLSFISAGFFLQAQSIGNSPYAAFGIGDVKYDNTVDINAMGGISTAYINDFTNRFNFKNPAANTNLQLATVSFSGTNENNYYKSDYKNVDVSKHSTYFSNISIAFPLSKKLKFGMGYQPYSSKSYDILTKSTDSANFVTAHRFHGEGMLNTVQAAFAYQVSPEFALGLRTNYYFGNLYDIDELTNSSAELVNGYENRKRVKTFNFTLGTTYQKKLANDRKLTLGATTTFGNTGNMYSFYTNSTYYYISNVKYQEAIVQNIVDKDKNLLPFEASIGAGYGKDARWFVGSQVDYKKGAKIQFMGQDFEYKDSYKISAGGWFLPNFNNFRNYLSRVTYRYGAYYEKGSLYLYGNNINKFALTAGVSLPFVGQNSRFSSMDIGVELGKRGTLQNNLISQKFINLRIGINFADRWFIKRQYD